MEAVHCVEAGRERLRSSGMVLHVLVHVGVRLFGCGRGFVGRGVVAGRRGASLRVPVTTPDFFFCL